MSDVSRLIGQIKRLADKLSSKSQFSSLKNLISKNPDIISYINVSIPDRLYHLGWKQEIEWALKNKLPIPHQRNRLPLIFRVAQQNDLKTMGQLVEANYDLNERVRVGDQYLSVYNFTTSNEMVKLIFDGGWRPCCTNQTLDIADIVLEKELDVEDTCILLKDYFDYEDPGSCQVHKGYCLLTWLVLHWTDQDPKILECLLEDPRWTFDDIRFALLLHLEVDPKDDLVEVMEQALYNHDDRPELFTGKQYIWKYLQQKPFQELSRPAYQTLLFVLARLAADRRLVDNYTPENISRYFNSLSKKIKEEYLFDSVDTYAWIDRQLALILSDLLPGGMTNFYDIVFFNNYWTLLGESKYSNMVKDVDKPTNIHESLLFQIDVANNIQDLGDVEFLINLYYQIYIMSK